MQFRDHPEIVAHEKHPRGFDIIDSYLSMTHSRSTSEDIDFDQWSYLSRVIQAEGISEGAKAESLIKNIVQELLFGNSTTVGQLPHGRLLTVTAERSSFITN